MKALVTGATGMIGRRVVERLMRDGWNVAAWVRSEKKARAVLGSGVELVPLEGGEQALLGGCLGCDAVINLAGEPLFAQRWTDKRRAELVGSRVFLTRQVVDALKKMERRPRVFVSASAVGYYGDRGDEELDETSAGGDDFLARLCAQWEEAAVEGEKLGIRVVPLRFGIVLSHAGGFLGKVLPQFKAGFGGTFGSGRQYMSWIHLDDLVEVIAVSLVDSRFAGAVNAVAPEPVTNKQFAKALGSVLRRPSIVPVPSMALKIAVGDGADALLAGQRVRPARLASLGFRYQYPEISEALSNIVSRLQ